MADGVRGRARFHHGNLSGRSGGGVPRPTGGGGHGERAAEFADGDEYVPQEFAGDVSKGSRQLSAED